MSPSKNDSSRRFRRIGMTLAISLVVTSMNGCDGFSWNDQNQALRVQEQGELRVLTLRHPLVDDPSRKGKGIEREMLTNFASTYGLKLRFIPKKTEEDLILGLQKGEGEIAAGRFWSAGKSIQPYLQGPIFEESHLRLFCRKQLRVQHVSDLAGRRLVLFKKDNLDSLDRRIQWLVPKVHLSLEPREKIRKVFQRLHQGSIDCAFAENIEGSLYLRMSSLIEKIEEPMTTQQGLSWLVRNDRVDLLPLMRAWFQKASRDDEIMRILDHHHAHLIELNHLDTQQFLSRLRSRLQPYRASFIREARAHHLDWRLLAAVAYQESHWNPHARSITGVRGLMQLTNETALAVGIQDRTDPEQSIRGGAFYLRYLQSRLPSHLDPQERLALTLAAYNSGLGHLRSAQSLAIQRGLNPFSWRHLKRVYPLLEDPAIAAQFAYGPARGRETTQYVERVRGFYQLWKMLEEPGQPRFFKEGPLTAGSPQLKASAPAL